jgi:beta-galactosidase
METYGQNSGFMLYRKPLSGYSGGTLGIQWVHDYATVFLNGTYQGGFSRPTVPTSYATPLKVTIDNNPLTLAASSTNTTLDILVEGMGRTNFGQALVDRKGILESVSLTNAGTLTGTLTGWQTYPLPVDEAYIAGLSPKVSDPGRPGIFFRTTFTLAQTGDTYVDVSGWTKGLIWVNGHNLGRYWQVGPQQRLYCPASWLVAGQNELIVLDLHQTVPQEITFQATLNGPGAGAPTTCTITNRRSGKALDVPGFSKTAGVQLIQWTPNGGTNQQWRRTNVGTGTYTLTNISSGQLADVNGSATADGTPIIQWPSTGGANQQWRVLTVDSTHVKLVNVATGKLLGVSGSATTDGAGITEQTDTGDISQQWVLTAV